MGLEQRLADYTKRLRAEAEHEAKRYQPSGVRLVILARTIRDLDNLVCDRGIDDPVGSGASRDLN
jgi:hypothetical protein